MRRIQLLTGLLVLILLGFSAQCPAPAAPTAAPGGDFGRETSLSLGTPAAAPTKAPAPIQPTPARPLPKETGSYPVPAIGGGAEGGIGGEGAGIPATAQPMIVKTATLSLVVPDVEDSLDSLTRIAATAGGYIVTSHTQMRGDRLYASVVMRVPVSTFEATLERVRGLAKEVRSYRVEGTDVTSEYVDLESRLKHLQAVEKELLAIMTGVREKSGSAEEVLKVYDRLLTVQAEIETVKGRMNYLSNLAAFSTITVDLEQEVVETPTPTPTPTATPAPTPTPVSWQPDKTLDEAVSSWVVLMQRLIDLGIWLSVYSTCLLPLLVIAGVVLLIVWIRRRRGKRA